MKKILLIEDDLHMCELLTDYMNCKGYHITAVHRLDSLVDISSMSDYCLILIDLGLPDGSGITAIKNIRNVCTSPIIVITGENSDNAKSICFTYGADDYVVKPFSITELESRIKANLRRVEIYDGTELRFTTEKCRRDPFKSMICLSTLIREKFIQAIGRLT